MKKSKLFNSVAAIIVSVSVMISSIFSVAAFDTEYISEDGMKLAYEIINGYSKLSAEKGLTNFKTSAVYCGLDVTNPYLIALAGCFYITNGVDIDRAMCDNEYAVTTVYNLDRFLQKMGVKNERAAQLKSELEKQSVRILLSLDTAGLYIIQSDEEFGKSLLNDKKVDFVLSGGGIPSSMKDLNFDGKSDKNDCEPIQKYLAGELVYDDNDKNEYIKFACDINGDKDINILDVTELQING